MGARKMYFCRLSYEGDISLEGIRGKRGVINREIGINLRIPCKDIDIVKATAKSDSLPNRWICIICGVKYSKYRAKRITQHLLTKYGGARINTNKNGIERRDRGMHIEKANDIAIQTDINYGRIKIVYGNNNNNGEWGSTYHRTAFWGNLIRKQVSWRRYSHVI